MKRMVSPLLAVLATALFVLNAHSLTGKEVLDSVEKSLTGPKDYEALAQMELANLDGSGREKRELRMWIAQDSKRLIKFLSPAGIEGIGLLNEADNEMYLYLPAQNKVRRIEGSVKNEDFQGTDFSYDEIASYEYQNDYEAVIDREDDAVWNMTLTRKSGSQKTYDRIVMVVDKSNNVPKKMDLYKDGKLYKVLTITEVKKNGSYNTPSRVRVENIEKKHFTEMVLVDVKYDQNLLTQDIFSKRFLKKKGK